MGPSSKTIRRALSFSGVLFIFTAFLPWGIQEGELIWPWRFLDVPGTALALVGLTAAGCGVLISARLPGLGQPHRAAAALGVVGTGLAVHMMAADGGVQLLPHYPGWVQSVFLLPLIAVVGTQVRSALRVERDTPTEPVLLFVLPLLTVVFCCGMAARFSDDRIALLGLRSAFLVLAVSLTATHGIIGVSKLAPSGRTWIAGLGILLVAGGAARFGASLTAERDEYPLRHPPPWALELYTDALPDLTIAADQVRRGAPVTHMRAPTQRAATLAQPAPEIASLIAEISSGMTSVAERRRSLPQLFHRLNRAARARGWALYADVELEALDHNRSAWLAVIHTYRIEAVRQARSSEGDHVIYWLDRIDRLSTLENRLGWRKPRRAHAVVLLDVIRRHWHEDLAPALGAVKKRRWRRWVHPVYRRAAPELQSDLEIDLDAARLSEDLGCRARWGPLMTPGVYTEDDMPNASARDCWRHVRGFEREVVRVLARRVENHEVQHAIDGGALELPDVIRARSGSENVARGVTSEVSAHLAEIARSQQPRWALVHLLVLGDEHGGQVMRTRDIVVDALNWAGADGRDVLRASRSELRDWAERGYVLTFGQPLPSVDLQSIRISPAAGFGDVSLLRPGLEETLEGGQKLVDSRL